MFPIQTYTETERAIGLDVGDRRKLNLHNAHVWSSQHLWSGAELAELPFYTLVYTVAKMRRS